MKKILKILIVEDNLSDAKLMELELVKAKLDFISKIVETKQTFLKELKNFKPDLILSDYSLPQFTGLDVLDLVKEKSPDTPIIIVTGTLNEETAVDVIKAGAWDYVLKERILRLIPAVNNALQLKDERDKIKQAEEAIQKSEEKYRSLVETIEEGIGHVDKNENFTFVNKAAANIFGYSINEMIGKNLKELTTPEMFHIVLEETSIRKKGKSSVYELTIIRKNGEERIITVLATPIITENGENRGSFGIFQDITERRRAEMEIRLLQKLTMAISEAPDFKTALDTALSLTCEHTGWLMGEAWILNNDKTALEYCLGYCDDSDEHNERLRRFIELSKQFTFPQGVGLPGRVWQSMLPEWRHDVAGLSEEIYLRAKPSKKAGLKAALGVPIISNGQVLTVLVFYMTTPQQEDERQIKLVSAVAAQLGTVILRKQAEEQIKRDLKEKEVLLQEVHHRVKNNMQVISSLLRLQSRYIKDEKALELFQNSQNRVTSMALIHESLYQSEDLAHINFADYVKRLTTQLLSSLAIYKGHINLKINIKDINLDINLAIPCGLIINELVSNSLKYAFPAYADKSEGRKGELSVSFTYENQTYILYVKDNGIGISEKINVKKPQTLGLLLVGSLTKQLRGTLELEKVKGTCFKITFQKVELKTYSKV